MEPKLSPRGKQLEAEALIVEGMRKLKVAQELLEASPHHSRVK